jgi:hypothetical protein
VGVGLLVGVGDSVGVGSSVGVTATVGVGVGSISAVPKLLNPNQKDMPVMRSAPPKIPPKIIIF